MEYNYIFVMHSLAARTGTGPANWDKAKHIRRLGRNLRHECREFLSWGQIVRLTIRLRGSANSAQMLNNLGI